MVKEFSQKAVILQKDWSIQRKKRMVNRKKIKYVLYKIFKYKYK